MQYTLISFFWLSFSALCAGQELTQTIRGAILDKDSQIPLIGAHVYVEKVVPMLGAVTQADGTFEKAVIKP